MKKRICCLIVALVMCMALFSSCAAAPSSASPPSEIIKPTAAATVLTGSQESPQEPQKGATGAVISGIGSTIISSLGEYFNLGIFADIGSSIFENIIDSIFSKDDSSQQILDQLQEIQDQLDGLSHKIDSQTEELKKAISDSELSSDLRKVNEEYAQVDRLYADYESILNIADESVRSKELEKFCTKTVPAANLRQIMTACGSYLTKTSSGSKALCELYYSSCCQTYPFEHQMAQGVNAFYQYHLSNIQRALVLYTKSCEYRAQDPNDPNDEQMLAANRAIDEVKVIYKSMSEQLHIDRLTENIKHSGKDALGNDVAFYVVRANNDGIRYAIVDKAYSYKDFYGEPKTGYYMYSFPPQPLSEVKCIQSKRTDSYDKLMNLPPTADTLPAAQGLVLRNPDEASALFRDAPANNILGYLADSGISIAGSAPESGVAFAFSEPVSHPSKDIPKGQINWGASEKHKKLESKESYYFQYFLTNSASSYKALNSAEKKFNDAIISRDTNNYPTRYRFQDQEKSSDYAFSNGTKQKLVYVDYSVDCFNKLFDFPVYLVYQLDQVAVA